MNIYKLYLQAFAAALTGSPWVIDEANDAEEMTAAALGVAHAQQAIHEKGDVVFAKPWQLQALVRRLLNGGPVGEDAVRVSIVDFIRAKVQEAHQEVVAAADGDKPALEATSLALSRLAASINMSEDIVDRP